MYYTLEQLPLSNNVANIIHTQIDLILLCEFKLKHKFLTKTKIKKNVKQHSLFPNQVLIYI